MDRSSYRKATERPYPGLRIKSGRGGHSSIPDRPDWAVAFGVERMRELYTAAAGGDKRAALLICDIYSKTRPVGNRGKRLPDAKAQERMRLYQKQLDAYEVAGVKPNDYLLNKIAEYEERFDWSRS